ncbi:MAG: polyprenyl diphosphate synthase [bacterium]
MIPVKEQAYPLKHLAVIMDGNNRWAQERGLSGIAGHENGVERIRTLLEACKEHNIDTLTLFAFSSENWARPEGEVRALMSLFASYLKREARRLAESNVRLQIIGSRKRFSSRLVKLIEEAEDITRHGARRLILAADYGGRWDIAEAAKSLARDVEKGQLKPDDIDEAKMQSRICLGNLPMPDLCIRTAGEHRLSNFLLWQLSYSELYFSDCYWPDFDAIELARAVDAYYNRQRRFGMTSEQMKLSRGQCA